MGMVRLGGVIVRAAVVRAMAAVPGALAQVALPTHREAGDEAAALIGMATFRALAALVGGCRGRSDFLESPAATLAVVLVQRHLSSVTQRLACPARVMV
jgi:hypothetical protein